MRRAVLRLLLVAALMLLPSPVVAQEHLSHALGDVELAPTVTGVLIVAPHGTFDANTAPLAIQAARRLGAGYVVARQFRVDRIRINVNRPTEGAGLPCAQEAHTARAKEVYELWSRAVSTAAGGRPLRLYVEVHGNSNPQAARAVEIASRGLAPADAMRLRDAYPAMLARARERVPAYPDIGILLEPLDKVRYAASCSKMIGTLATDLAPRALHLEFPRAARTDETLEATAMLVADLVRQLVID